LSQLAVTSPNKVPKVRREFFNRGRLSNPKFYSYANRVIRKQAVGGIHELENSERDDLGRKFFALDHTAEVLENYRRIKENEIYTKVLHDERLKKSFLRNESRKPQNLLHNFQSNLEIGIGAESAQVFTKSDFLKQTSS
jgi:hypothetical protein